MKAAILAGGFGTRLRPLTEQVPKPLVTLVDRPLVMHIIDSLPEEVDTVLLAVNYRYEQLEEYFDRNDVGRDVVLVKEDEPLGTGGALKNLESELDDTFIAFNGDVVCSIDLGAFLRSHRSSGCIGTMALWRVDDPSAFGVVALDGERIIAFQEKPAPGEEMSDLINAGVYAYEPEILDRIPRGPVSMEREVFPNVIDDGLQGFRFDGYWVDCGTLDNYIEAQGELLSIMGLSNHLMGACAGDASGSCSESGSSIDEGAVVIDSAVMRGARVMAGSRVVGSIVCPGATVRPGDVVERTIFG